MRLKYEIFLIKSNSNISNNNISNSNISNNVIGVKFFMFRANIWTHVRNFLVTNNMLTSRYKVVLAVVSCCLLHCTSLATAAVYFIYSRNLIQIKFNQNSAKLVLYCKERIITYIHRIL